MEPLASATLTTTGQIEEGSPQAHPSIPCAQFLARRQAASLCSKFGLVHPAPYQPLRYAFSWDMPSQASTPCDSDPRGQRRWVNIEGTAVRDGLLAFDFQKLNLAVACPATAPMWRRLANCATCHHAIPRIRCRQAASPPPSIRKPIPLHQGKSRYGSIIGGHVGMQNNRSNQLSTTTSGRNSDRRNH
jgi:hypothetical protein